MSERSLSIRLAVRDGDVVRRALVQLGEDGSRALARIENAAKPASRGLLALNEVTSAARGRLEDYAGNLGGVGAAMLRLGPAGLVAGTALGGLAVALGQGLQEMESAERSLLRLEAVLKATGHASGLTGRDLGELADAMEASTLATAEGVMDAASVLATFRSISGDTFLRTIKAAQDLSTVFGQDLRASAVQLGKALEDPVEGVTALKRVGVTFTAVQRDMIAAMVETGDVAGAQALILETLERQVGGAGEAEAKGLTGAVHHLKSAWGNLLEELAKTPAVGGVVQTTITGLTRLINDARELFQAPDISQQVAEKSRRLAEVESRIGEYEAAGAGRRRLDALKQQAALLRQEIDALVEQGRQEVAAFEAEQEQAQAGRRQAQEERNSEAIATRIKALEAEKVKSAVDAAEKIAAVNAQLARDIAAADRKRGLPGIADADIDREIALLKDIAARKIEAVEKPLREAAARTGEQAQKVIADLERQLGAAFDPRQAAIDQTVARLPEGATDGQRREVERLSGALYDQKLALDELQKELEEEARLREKGAEITRRHRTAEEEYRDTLAELDTLLANAALDQETYGRAVEEAERRKLNSSREWRDGAVRAMRDYVDAATDAASAAEEATTLAFRSMEDALVTFATTGKFEFSSLADSILADITRIAVCQAITAPLAGFLSDNADDLLGGLGQAVAGLFHTGGIVGVDPVPSRAVDPLLFLSAPRFHTGGIAGLMPDEVPAILKRGEAVLTPQQMAALGTGQRAEPAPRVTVVMNIATPDSNGFRYAQGQIAAEAARALDRARRNL